MPKWTHIRCLSGLAALPLALMVSSLCWAAELGDVIGTAVRVQGQANSVMPGVPSRSLAQGDTIRFGEEVVTGQDARAQLRLLDDTDIILGENSRLAIDEYVYEPERGKGAATMRMAAGVFRAVTGAIGKAHPDSVSVITPVATIGIRGTTFWGGPIDGVYGVLVQDGRVEVRNSLGTVELSAGEGTTLGSAATAPSSPVTWSEGRKARALETVTFR